MTEVGQVFEASFDGSEGRVFYRRWDSDVRPVRLVLIVHGYAEHGGRYGHVAAALTQRGSVVYADDHLGHGRSDGERALITDFEHVIDDLHTLAGIARYEHPGLPLVLVGHSMGSLLSARFAERWPDEVAGVAFCGSVIGDWGWARDVLAEPELPYIALDPEALSRDPGAGASYAADPFVPYERSLEAVRAMPTRDLTVHVYDGARHEVSNETNRNEVIGHLSDWVDRIAPAR